MVVNSSLSSGRTTAEETSTATGSTGMRASAMATDAVRPPLGLEVFALTAARTAVKPGHMSTAPSRTCRMVERTRRQFMNELIFARDSADRSNEQEPISCRAGNARRESFIVRPRAIGEVSVLYLGGG